MSSVSSIANLDRMDRINNLLSKLKNSKFTEKETNTLYKNIISSIIAKRKENDDTEIIVNFL